MSTAQSLDSTHYSDALYFFQFTGSDLTAGGVIKGAGFEYLVNTPSLSTGSAQHVTSIYRSGALVGEISWNTKDDIWHHETTVRMGGNAEWIPWMKFLKPLPIEEAATAQTLLFDGGNSYAYKWVFVKPSQLLLCTEKGDVANDPVAVLQVGSSSEQPKRKARLLVTPSIYNAMDVVIVSLILAESINIGNELWIMLDLEPMRFPVTETRIT